MTLHTCVSIGRTNERDGQIEIKCQCIICISIYSVVYIPMYLDNLSIGQHCLNKNDSTYCESYETILESYIRPKYLKK